MKNSNPQVVIVGAGLAGIAAAIRLRHAGKSVVMLERNATFGGKLSEFEEKGYRFDKGPSLFTDPKQVDELFELCGKNPRDYFSYQLHETACTYYFQDGSSVKFSGNHDRLKEELTQKFSGSEAHRVLTYLERSQETYKRIGDFFIDNPPVGLRDIFRKDLLIRYPHFLTAKLRKTLHQYNHSSLKEAKLVQIFDRFGTYNGSNPYKMSGLYSMIPHLEHNTGTYFPTKGMREIVESVYNLAAELGVEFYFDVKEIEATKSEHGYLIKSDAGNFEANNLICAIDHLTFYRNILKDEKLFQQYVKQERSSSAIVFYWGIKSAEQRLGLHNIFFSTNYRAEFEAIFNAHQLPEDPTIYVHVSSLLNQSDAPNGGQNWFVMVNTPAGYEPNEAELIRLKKGILERLNKAFQRNFEPEIEVERIWTSAGIETDTGSYAGALYGASSNGKIAALKRHANKSKKYPGLFFCGGTVHPGGGIPLVLKSAKIVAQYLS